MEAGEYGLTRGTCFHCMPSRVGRGRRDAVDFVVFFGWGGFFSRVFFFDFFFFKRTRPGASMRPPCLIYLSTSIEAVLAYRAKQPLHTGVRTGCHCFISVSVCLRNIRVFY